MALSLAACARSVDSDASHAIDATLVDAEYPCPEGQAYVRYSAPGRETQATCAPVEDIYELHSWFRGCPLVEFVARVRLPSPVRMFATGSSRVTLARTGPFEMSAVAHFSAVGWHDAGPSHPFGDCRFGSSPGCSIFWDRCRGTIVRAGRHGDIVEWRLVEPCVSSRTAPPDVAPAVTIEDFRVRGRLELRISNGNNPYDSSTHGEGCNIYDL